MQVIAAGRRKHFYVYDLAGGQVQRVAGIVGRAEKSCEGFAASLAAGGPPLLAFYGNEGHIPLVSLKSRQAVGTLKMNGSVRSAAFSADGNQVRGAKPAVGYSHHAPVWSNYVSDARAPVGPGAAAVVRLRRCSVCLGPAHAAMLEPRRGRGLPTRVVFGGVGGWALRGHRFVPSSSTELLWLWSLKLSATHPRGFELYDHISPPPQARTAAW